MTDSKTILDFWFVELHPKQHWIKDPKLDDEIKTRFERTLFQARACELFEWRKNPKGRLAEIIVLDQFSRNIYRGFPESFTADPQALTLAQEAVADGHDELEPLEKAFLYMPFMHVLPSENPDEQKHKPSSRTLSGIDQRHGGTDPALHQSNPDVPLFGTWEGLATQI